LLRELNSRPDDELNTISLAKSLLIDEEAVLVVDDGRIAKPYAELIEGASLGHDGSSHRVVMGLQMVTAMLVTSIYKLPVEVQEYINKWLIGSSYLTKSDIAEMLTRKLMNTFNISRVIADAHYATHQFISFLTGINLPYLMKFPCSRKVTLFDKNVKLNGALRLRRNERVRCKKGFYKGIPCFFYVVKYDKYKTIYLISSDYIDPHTVIELYKIRWNIEMFHRTAKQHLGYSHCQSRFLAKQLQHCRFVMLAYALADVFRHHMKLSTTEDAIRLLRDVKSPIPHVLQALLDQDFEFNA
jgi:hypothetical protein